jgi:hypothetical protein
MPVGLRDHPPTETAPIGFDELKRRIDHLYRMMQPGNAAPGCFTYTAMIAHEMNALMARWKGDPDDVCNNAPTCG